MSVSWGVIPIVPEIHDWLKEYGFVIKTQKTRYPTLDELILVLESFDLPLRKEQIKGNLFGITMGVLHSSQYVHILGTVGEDGFEFHFWGSFCVKKIMLEILKRLSLTCGALVIYASGEPKPLVVDSETDIEESNLVWAG